MSSRAPIVSLAQAFELARAALDAANAEPDGNHQLAVIDDQWGQLWWAWIVPCQSVEYCRTRDPMKGLLLGLGPLLVDKFTGEVISTGTGSRIHEIERKRGYRAWWKVWGPNSIMALQFTQRAIPRQPPHR